MKGGIKKLYIEPTSLCNLNCSICFRKSWVNEKLGTMNSNIIDRIYKEVKTQQSIVKVVFAGMGEPSLHSEIFNMVKYMSQLGILVEIITNGTLLYPQASEKLIDSGLTYIWISVDDSHIQSAKNDVLRENIKYFNEIRCNKCGLGLTYALTNPNTDDLVQIKKQAEYFHADEVNVSQIIPNEKIKNLEYNPDIPIGKTKICDIYTSKKRKFNYCPFVEKNCAFIKWNGDIVPCMQLLHSSYTYLFDERRLVTAYSFGNILESSIENIWNCTEYKSFRNMVKNFEFPDCTLCNGCDDRKENITDCMYNTMPTCGACLWAQNIARCP